MQPRTGFQVASVHSMLDVALMASFYGIDEPEALATGAGIHPSLTSSFKIPGAACEDLTPQPPLPLGEGEPEACPKA